MTEEIIEPEVPAVPAVAPVEAPAPVVAETPAAPEAVVVEPVAPTEPALAEAQKEPGVKHPADIPTLLESVGKEEKPDAPADATTEAEKPAEPVAPQDYTLNIPEYLDAKDERFGEFRTILGEHHIPQEIGQKLLDMHATAVQAYQTTEMDRQIAAFNGMRSQWVNEVKADPQIGGAGHQTAMSAVARVRDLGVSSARAGSDEYNADVAAFDQMLRVTGVGDHPAFLKMLHNIARYVDEPSLPPANPKPSPNNGKPPRGNKLATLYDNPEASYNR
jgi:hypothetical protein